MYSYESTYVATQRWNMAMAAIAGFCGVVAVASVASLVATPSNLYAPAAVRTTTRVAPVNQARFVRESVVASAQQVDAAPEQVYVYESQASASWAPRVSFM